MVTITDPRPQRFGRIFEKLAAREPLHSLKIKAAAEGLWPSLEGHGVDGAAMGCDAALITLGLAKDEGGVVYKNDR